MPDIQPADRTFGNLTVKLSLATVEGISQLFNEYQASGATDGFGMFLVAKNFITDKQYATMMDIVKNAPTFAGPNINYFGKNKPAAEQATPSEDSSAALIGERYSTYKLTGLIGKGGLGRVFQAEDYVLGRRVAIKELIGSKRTELTGDDEAEKTEADAAASAPSDNSGDKSRDIMRFLNEAQITGQLQHPGIVPVYQLSIHPSGKLFYAMKYVLGKSLDKFLEKDIEDCKNLDDPREMFQARMHQLRSLIEVCNAVAYAHAKGIVHRDLKPENIIVGTHGETVILDWGLAKKFEPGNEVKDALDPDSASDPVLKGESAIMSLSDKANLSLDGEVVGTPAYIAPEVLSPILGPISPKTDVYALGTILYKILTGRLPYDYETVHQLLVQKANLKPPLPPSKVNPLCPPELEAICLRALECVPDERTITATQLAQELQAYLEGRMLSTYQYAPFERLLRKIMRHKLVSFLLLLMCILLVAAMMFGLHYNSQARDASKIAEQQAHDTELAVRRSERLGKVAQQAIEELPELQNQCLRQSLAISRGLRRYFSNLEVDMENAAKYVSGEEQWTSDVLQLALEQVLVTQTDVENFVLLDDKGVVEAVMPQKYDYMYGLDFSSRRHVRRVLNEGRTIFSSLYTSEEGLPALSLCCPVVQQNKTAGVLNAFFLTNEVFPNLLKSFRSDSKNDIFRIRIVQSDGVMLYDSEDMSLAGQNMVSAMYERQMPNQTKFYQGILTNEMGVSKFVIDRNPYVSVNGPETEHEIGAWQTFTFAQATWKIAVTVQFREGTGLIPFSFEP